MIARTTILIQIAVALGPLNEPTQHIVPMSLMPRDCFKVPFCLHFSPRLEPSSEDFCLLAVFVDLLHASFRNLSNDHVLAMQTDVL